MMTDEGSHNMNKLFLRFGHSAIEEQDLSIILTCIHSLRNIEARSHVEEKAMGNAFPNR